MEVLQGAMGHEDMDEVGDGNERLRAWDCWMDGLGLKAECLRFTNL